MILKIFRFLQSTRRFPILNPDVNVKNICAGKCASTMRAATQPRQLLVLFSLVGAILTARTADGFLFPAGQPASLPDSTQVGT
jgi:hypothetical protein